MKIQVTWKLRWVRREDAARPTYELRGPFHSVFGVIESYDKEALGRNNWCAQSVDPDAYMEGRGILRNSTVTWKESRKEAAAWVKEKVRQQGLITTSPNLKLRTVPAPSGQTNPGAFRVRCPDCGWRGSSSQCRCEPPAEDESFSSHYCPYCDNPYGVDEESCASLTMHIYHAFKHVRWHPADDEVGVLCPTCGVGTDRACLCSEYTASVDHYWCVECGTKYVVTLDCDNPISVRVMC